MKNKGSVRSSDVVMTRLCSEPSLLYCLGGILVFTGGGSLENTVGGSLHVFVERERTTEPRSRRPEPDPTVW